MAVDPPERDERERRPREERAIGSARCDLLQYLVHVFQFLHNYIPHICISVHLMPGTHISLVQVGPAGSRVGWSAVLQARSLLCKPGDSVSCLSKKFLLQKPVGPLVKDRTLLGSHHWHCAFLGILRNF